MVARAKINESGRILVPLVIRRELGLESDDDVLLYVQNGELIITPLKTSVERLQNKVAQRNIHKRPLTRMLESMDLS